MCGFVVVNAEDGDLLKNEETKPEIHTIIRRLLLILLCIIYMLIDINNII